MLARAEGVGNVGILLGSSTGRDGIGGASVLASAGFEEGSEAKRPSVQVGDPFEEKRLIEACLALLDAGLAVGVQDLGAAGLSCALSETAAAAGNGMDVDLVADPPARAGDGPGRGDDVGEPGADARDRDARERRRGARPRDPVGDQGQRRGPGHRHRPLPRLRLAVRRRRRVAGRRDRRRAVREPRRRAGVRPAARAARPIRTRSRPPIPRPRCSSGSPTGPTSRASCSRSSPRRPSPTSRGSGASTTTSSSSTPSSDPAATRRCCGSRARTARSRSPPTARPASADSTRRPADGSSCSRPPATSRAPAPCPRRS